MRPRFLEATLTLSVTCDHTQGLTFCLGDLWSLMKVGISHAFRVSTYGTLRLESDDWPSPCCELALGSSWLPRRGLSFSICKVDVLRSHFPFSPSSPLSFRAKGVEFEGKSHPGQMV